MSVRKEVEHKHIQWFVLGALTEYRDRGAIQLSEERFQEFFGKTVNIVIGYLKGTRRLDGGVHDLQCIIAEEAKKVFSGKDAS